MLQKSFVFFILMFSAFGWGQDLKDFDPNNLFRKRQDWLARLESETKVTLWQAPLEKKDFDVPKGRQYLRQVQTDGLLALNNLSAELRQLFQNRRFSQAETKYQQLKNLAFYFYCHEQPHYASDLFDRIGWFRPLDAESKFVSGQAYLLGGRFARAGEIFKELAQNSVLPDKALCMQFWRQSCLINLLYFFEVLIPQYVKHDVPTGEVLLKARETMFELEKVTLDYDRIGGPLMRDAAQVAFLRRICEQNSALEARWSALEVK